jgi:hypothetical protein
MHAWHGQEATLEKIVKRFEMDWDRVYVFKGSQPGSGRESMHGYFTPFGARNMSRHGIALNLFFIAASIVFECDGRSNWKKSRRWMQQNLFDILLFAENPTDSAFFQPIDDWYREHGQSDYKREEKIRSVASMIYGWILRKTRPWYRHPRWHIHHWRIQIHPIGQFKRWAFSRCCKCGSRFRWGESPTTDNWNSLGPRWFRSEPDVYHGSCGGVTGSATEPANSLSH